MKKALLLILFSFLLACNTQPSGQTTLANNHATTFLPKALFITTGLDFTAPDLDLPHSIIVAIQSFNQKGITLRLEPRDVLFDRDLLNNYDIIILSSSRNIHDTDRELSLTYMTDAELQNLTEFVQNGGVIIAGDNIGRNYFDGTDRILNNGKLTPENYPLSNAFGISLTEKNMQGFQISGSLKDVFEGDILPQTQDELWTLVSDSIFSKKIKILAQWKNDSITKPAVIQNFYGKGMAFLLPTSDLIDTKGETVKRSYDQIASFYNYVINQYNTLNNLKITVNPWPNGHKTAFGISFNPTGNIDNYKFIYEKCKKENIQPTFFVNGTLNDTIRNFLVNNKAIIASNGYAYQNYYDVNYPLAVKDILLNENSWNKKFSGFRFPFTTPEFSGILALDMHNYHYESSISVNNIEFMHGSVFPYNIVIATDHFYKSTDLYEISPTYHDDYFFLHKLLKNEYATPKLLQKDVLLYQQYLQDFWQYAVKPHNGLMIYMGHPGLVGANDTTYVALDRLIKTVKNDKAWITTIEQVADYRNKVKNLRLAVQHSKHKTKISVKLPENITIENLTLNLFTQPKTIRIKKGKYDFNDKTNQLIFNAFNGQEVEVLWE